MPKFARISYIFSFVCMITGVVLIIQDNAAQANYVMLVAVLNYITGLREEILHPDKK